MTFSQFLFRFFLAFLLAIPFSLAPISTWAQNLESSPPDVNPLTFQAEISPHQLHPDQNFEVRLKIFLLDEFKAYEDQFQVAIISENPFKIGQLKITPVQEFFDKFSKKTRKGVSKEALITFQAEAPSKFSQSELDIQLTYQACTEKFCLFPKTTSVKVPVQFIDPANASSPSQVSEESDLIQFKIGSWSFSRNNLFLLFFGVFLFGVLTSLTPCLFPLIPITMTIFTKAAHANQGKVFGAAIVYVLGMCLTYAGLGVFAASTGSLFGALFSNTYFLIFVAALVFAMSLSMLGFYDLELPAFLTQGKWAQMTPSGPLGIFASGLISGLIASPCVSPVLVSILTYVAQSQDRFLGFWLMFTYSLGMGTLFLVLGSSSGFLKKLPKSGGWMDVVKRFLGAGLLGVVFYYLSLILNQRWWDFSLGLGFILVGFSLMKSIHALKHLWLRGLIRALLQTLTILGVMISIGSVFDLRQLVMSRLFPSEHLATAQALEFEVYSEAAYQSALQSGQPVIIDFNAEWCLACHELEQKTFTDTQVMELGQNFRRFKFDATKDSPELDQLKAKYNIIGLPTLVFYSASGKWQKDLTLTEFESAEKFLARIKKVKERP